MDTFLEWKIVIGRKRFTSGHRTLEEEEEEEKEDRNNHKKNEVTDFTNSKNMEEYMAEDIQLWRLVEGS